MSGIAAAVAGTAAAASAAAGGAAAAGGLAAAGGTAASALAKGGKMAGKMMGRGGGGGRGRCNHESAPRNHGRRNLRHSARAGRADLSTQPRGPRWAPPGPR